MGWEVGREAGADRQSINIRVFSCWGVWGCGLNCHVNLRHNGCGSASTLQWRVHHMLRRVEATALLQRQQQLEELLDKTRGNSRN